LRLRAPEVNLVHDGQNRDFKQNRVQPRPDDQNLQIVTRRANRDVRTVEVKQREEIYKVAFHVAQCAQVIQLVVVEMQFTQRINLAIDLVGIRRERNALVPALEAVFHLRAGELMQNRLHHGEFVQVSIEKGANDHGFGSNRAVQAV